MGFKQKTLGLVFAERVLESLPPLSHRNQPVPTSRAPSKCLGRMKGWSSTPSVDRSCQVFNGCAVPPASLTFNLSASPSQTPGQENPRCFLWGLARSSGVVKSFSVLMTLIQWSVDICAVYQCLPPNRGGLLSQVFFWLLAHTWSVGLLGNYIYILIKGHIIFIILSHKFSL